MSSTAGSVASLGSTASDAMQNHFQMTRESRRRSPTRLPAEEVERSWDDLIRAGWTKRKAVAVARRYQKWGYDDVSKQIQRDSKDGWLSWKEALLMAGLSEDCPAPSARDTAGQG